MENQTLTRTSFPGLSGNLLKILAAICMTVDHVGLVFFPLVPVLRYIGRLAFPIFGFMIAEGCAHTRSMGRYFAHVALLAAICQTAYTVAMGQWYLCAPVSFALAIALVFLLDKGKCALCASRWGGAALWGGAFLASAAAVWLLAKHVTLDYGFWGCMMPVGASLLRQNKQTPKALRGLDRNAVHVLAMGLAMIPLALEAGAWQWWSFLALPVLILYSGKRGRGKMKYFFYIFYPAHLLAVQGISMLLQMLQSGA